MVRRKKRSKSWLIIIGSFLFLFGISFILYDYLSNRVIEIKENEALEEFYIIEEKEESSEVKEPQKKEVNNQIKTNYIAVLKIPKIDLERGLVDPNSYLNSIEYNLQIIKGSSMPNIENSNLIIASHSGTARISYFRNLYKLNLNDDIYLIYKNKTYKYKVSNKYEIDKTGTAKIIRDKNTTTLTLITCKYRTNKQIVVIATLQE